jgi:ATP-binding cassette subfamily C (CFTR/MRP) protein 1
LPYCDHIVALDKEGKIVEQGAFEKLNTSGGYVSGFDLALADWDYSPEKHVYEAPPRYTERQASSTKLTEEDIQAEANRRTGDTAIYLYYIKSVGWIPTIIFVVSIVIFIFGISFPSKYLTSDLCACRLTFVKLFGSRCGRSTTKTTLISASGSILAFTPCWVVWHSSF